MPPRGRPRTYHTDRPATTAEGQRRFIKILTDEVTTLRAKTAQRVYLTSIKQDYETPWSTFDAYDAEFHFTLDVCANAANTKCARYFTVEMDGLAQDWGTEICWCNPPYKTLVRWVEKAYLSSLGGATVVCYIPVRAGSIWWQDWVDDKAEVRKHRKRERFVGMDTTAPFSSAAVIYRPPASAT